MSLYNKIIDLQKLNMAWKRVKMNKPSPGVDGVTWDVYDASASEENKRLHKELAEKANNLPFANKYERVVTKLFVAQDPPSGAVSIDWCEELRLVYDTETLSAAASLS